MHARGLRPRGVRECQASYRHPRCGLPLVGRRRHPNFQNFAAQYPAYMCPYQRLAPCLTTDRPWLGVGMVRQPLPHDSFLRYTPVVYPGASPRSTPEPEPGSRHLHAGHHLGSRQVLSQTHPEVTTRLGFDAVDTLSTRHQWFTRVRLPGSYLTHYSCALSVRSPRQLLTDAACGGLTPPPARRRRRAHPHLWCSRHPSGSTFYIDPSFSLRGALSSA